MTGTTILFLSSAAIFPVIFPVALYVSGIRKEIRYSETVSTQIAPWYAKLATAIAWICGLLLLVAADVFRPYFIAVFTVSTTLSIFTNKHTDKSTFIASLFALAIFVSFISGGMLLLSVILSSFGGADLDTVCTGLNRC